MGIRRRPEKQTGQAFDQVFDDVYDFAMRVLRSPDRAADVAHATTAKMSRELRRRRAPDRFKAEAFAIAAPMVLAGPEDFFGATSRGSQPTPRWSDLLPVPMDEQELAGREQAANAAWMELAKLEREDYCLVELHLRHNLSANWIAQVLKREKEDVHDRIEGVERDLERAVRLRLVEERCVPRCAQLRADLRDIAPDAPADARRLVIQEHTYKCGEQCGFVDMRASWSVSIVKDLALIPAAAAVKNEIRDQINGPVGSFEQEQPKAGRWRRRIALVTTVLAATAVIGGGAAAIVTLSARTPNAVTRPSVSFSPTPSTTIAAPVLPTPAPRKVVARPGQPFLRVRSTEPSAVILDWADGKGARALRFIVQRADGSGSFHTLRTTKARSLYDDVAVGRSYRYRVAGISKGGRGRYSNVGQITITPPPAPAPRPPPPPAPAPLSAPQNLRVTPNNCTATISWSAPKSSGSSAIIGYVVWRAAKSGATRRLTPNPIKSTSFHDADEAGNQSWSYRVAAVNKSGRGPAAQSAMKFIPCG